MREEYDFRGGVRGKYYGKITGIVVERDDEPQPSLNGWMILVNGEATPQIFKSKREATDYGSSLPRSPADTITVREVAVHFIN